MESLYGDIGELRSFVNGHEATWFKRPWFIRQRHINAAAGVIWENFNKSVEIDRLKTEIEKLHRQLKESGMAKAIERLEREKAEVETKLDHQINQNKQAVADATKWRYMVDKILNLIKNGTEK